MIFDPSINLLDMVLYQEMGVLGAAIAAVLAQLVVYNTFLESKKKEILNYLKK